ncbi:MAG: dihydropteroate synthase [Desulfobacterales bacterium]|nr:dihydropteroate synthase [Desulfobacterales bacterium]
MEIFKLTWGSRCLELGRRTRIMGILNVTPDSFSDGGKFFSFDTALARAEKMVQEGADIIDIGGESSRPFSDPVPVEEEIRRVVPLIKALAKRIAAPISIDTVKAEVARRAIEAGASIINDISALRSDPAMADLAARCGVPVILMHMQGMPKTMQVSPAYGALVAEIKTFLADAICRAQDKGILKSRIIVDPGIGFGKEIRHNLMLINCLHAFTPLGIPLLIGPSRKSFIQHILKHELGRDMPPDLAEVETGTQAAVAAAVFNGAHIVRVHNVAQTRITVNIVDAIKHAGEPVGA